MSNVVTPVRRHHRPIIANKEIIVLTTQVGLRVMHRCTIKGTHVPRKLAPVQAPGQLAQQAR